MKLQYHLIAAGLAVVTIAGLGYLTSVLVAAAGWQPWPLWALALAGTAASSMLGLISARVFTAIERREAGRPVTDDPSA